MDNNDFYKIGRLNVFKKMTKEEAIKGIKEVIAKLKPFFIEDCVIPVSTNIGNDVIITVSVEKENVKLEFEEIQNGIELPVFYSYEQWKLSILTMVYKLISDNGKTPALREASSLLHHIKNMKSDQNTKVADTTNEYKSEVKEKQKKNIKEKKSTDVKKTITRLTVDELRSRYDRRI